MREIEAKFYVRDIEGIRMRLQQLEAPCIQERILETNLRFDRPDGSLHSGRRVLRLRRDSVARLTYKDSGESTGGVSSRREIELIVEDFDEARSLLEALGYQVIFRYEKFRTTHQLGDAHVMLDELPFGNFIEIEGGNVADIQSAAGSLKLDWDQSITDGYPALYEKLCASRRELDPGCLTFESLQGIKLSKEDFSFDPADP